MSKNFALLKCAFDISEKLPHVKQGFNKFYGKDCFSRWAHELRGTVSKQANSIMPPVREKKAAFTPRPVYRNRTSLIPDEVLPVHPLQSGKLQVYIQKFAGDLNEDQTFANLTEADREKLLHDTVLIKDERDPQETSQTYSTQAPTGLQNPDKTGVYSILERPDKFSDMLVIAQPYSNSGKADFATVVRLDDGSKAWINSHASNIWSDQAEESKDYNKWFEGLAANTSLTVKGLYVAIGPNGEGTVPFKVKETYSDGSYVVDFEEHCNYDNRRSNLLPRVADRDYDGDYISPYGAKLYFNAEGPQGTKLKAIQGELRVPSTFKFLKIKDPPSPVKADGGNCCGCSILPDSTDNDPGTSDPRPIELGKMEDIQLLFTEKTARLKLWSDHHEVIVSSDWDGVQRMSKTAALINLVREHGLNETTSRFLLKEANLQTPKTYRVFYAPGFGTKRDKAAFDFHSLLSGGPSAPELPAQEYGFEDYGGRSGARTTEPDEHHLQIPGMSATDSYDPSVYDNWNNYTHEDFQHTMGQAQQAAQSGQKEVFDTAMISGMLKSVRQDSAVDKYLGDLMKALDKLGRIIFLFYWHQEEFEDRYGKSELPELEDSLRNSFESLGDITLFLKEKTVEPSFSQEGGDPDIDDSARN